MFSDNLATSLLLICDARKLSYDRASEQCECSSKEFGNIVRRQASPNLRLFEQMCRAFDATPNQLLRVEAEDALSYRSPMAVREFLPCGTLGQSQTLPVCPRCEGKLERNQAYCACCGQCLDWSAFEKAVGRKK